jgi:toxin ParE1/3/4
MGRVRWTSEAEIWLRDIHDYIARDNPAAARRTIERLYRKAEVLAAHPEIGYLYADGEPEPVRILLYGHYRIAYRILPDDEVHILGVFHGALDIGRYLG